jgi:hypothetical protein
VTSNDPAPTPNLPSREISGLPMPLSEQPWSADFVMQAIEVLPVALEPGGIVSLRPQHADSFIIAWPAQAKPEEVAAKALTALGFRPIVLHSTSWRHAGPEVVLTYLAVVSFVSVPESWLKTGVKRTDLARGDATQPPPVIGVNQVLEHALRHLAWLVKEDTGIAAALPGWHDLLDGYVPEPFRAFAGQS